MFSQPRLAMLRRDVSNGRFSPRLRLERALVRFRDEESGVFVIWALFMVVAILLATGTGISIQLHEVHRARLQNVLDTAVLAATDLDQSRDSEEVIADYLERAGLLGSLGRSRVINGVNYRTTYVAAEVTMPTFFMPGPDEWPIVARSEATENYNDIEIAVALDNSGSMGWNDDFRLNLLKPAAQNFIDTVTKVSDDGIPGATLVSIVPFSTQVNAGPVLGGEMTWSGEHNYSQCARFESDDFSSTQLDPDVEIEQAAHFDIFTWDSPVDTEGVVCPFDASRHITPWSQKPDELKAQVEDMWAGGNTSIDVATKWAAALIDPSMSSALTNLQGDGVVEGNVSGQPFSYTRENTVKILVIMSDGQNTDEYRLKDDYRDGDSPLYVDAETVVNEEGEEVLTGNVRWSYRYTSTSYYWYRTETWEETPDTFEDGTASRMQWPQVLDEMSVAHFARYYKSEALGGSWRDYYNEMYTWVSSSTKNSRLSNVCQAARDNEVVVYTIGMDTYGEGDAVLLDCAGTAANFYDIEALEIAEAFSSIARQISQLRLTQ
ncbi:MAG: pilus assembly protein [Pseudomonadota bacterium]